VSARAAVMAHPFWYHTMDLGGGVTTPGWFDLRRAAATALPWPEVRGRRCLDVGTYDGFLAFELEQRGAAEVVAVDIEDHDRWDWPPDARPDRLPPDQRDAGFKGPRKGDGFRLAREIRGSKVDWRPVSIYDLDPADLGGRFDVVTIGTLLLHLRDPIRALEAVRGILQPDGHLLSSEQIELWLSIAHRRDPIFRLNGSGGDCQWWLANAAGHVRMLYAAGFEPVRTSKPYVVAFNHHPKPQNTARHLARRAVIAALTGGDWRPGVFHRAVLARPRL
jgi:tRNA (mo5U34)-methyltransferase